MIDVDCLKCQGDAIDSGQLKWWGGFMVVCSECGNKRCPKASWHENACTGSNEPGQPGSAYRKIVR